jgi:DHA2 family multidrug resistance protein
MLEEGQQDDWFDSGFIRACFALTIVGLATFVVRELNTDHPVVDLRVLRYRSLWSGSIMSVVIGMALYGALFAIPIFAQSMLHFTAQDTGWLLFPSAIAAGITFPIAARLLGLFDPRVMLAGGAVILGTAVIQLAHLAPQTGAGDLFWPLMTRSFGTVFMFLPLTMATIGPIPKKDVAAATGFFSLTRQMGGSIGVAILTVFLSRREAFHRTVLIEKVAQGGALVEQRLGLMSSLFTSHGVDPIAAHGKALGLLDGLVSQQAAVMAFGDCFWATAALVFGTLPFVMLLGRPDKGAKVAADAH